MRKTIIGFALGALLFALCLPAEAQQASENPKSLRQAVTFEE